MGKKFDGVEIEILPKKVMKRIMKGIESCELEGCLVPADIIDTSSLQAFSDIYVNKPVHGLSGTKVKFDDIINRHIVITAYRTGLKSHYQRTKECETYTVIQFFFVDDPTQELHIFNTGSEVLLEKLNALQHKIPFKATIYKENRCLKFK